ncbi:16259_t:CDS:2, partial [Dentiscutata erythropus]
GVQVTVERRFSQFEWLYNRLVVKFGALVLPPLPEKQYTGRFNEEFIEKRRSALERFINRLARHPVIRYSDILTHFLSCNDDLEWRKQEKEFDSDKIV